MFQSLTGEQYLKAEVACLHDKAFEKATWDERIAHYDSLDFSNANTFKKASNPIGLRAGVNAMDCSIEGSSTGYMISLDACSSGLQILSLLVSCPTSFSLCGGNSAQCVDSYVTLYDAMNLHGALTRKEVKNAIMTAFYGSTAMPESTFGSNVDVFYDTVEDMAPGAWDLNLGLQELWDDIQGSDYGWILPDNFHAYIETKSKELVPFKFLDEEYKLAVKVDERPEFHKGLGPNLIHSVDGMVVREMFRRCMFNKEHLTNIMTYITTGEEFILVNMPMDERIAMTKTIWGHYLDTGFLSSRILDFLDAATLKMVDTLVIAKLIQSMPANDFDLVSVHDCFRCHPNYGDDLRRQYNTIMADINDSTLLTFMCSQVAKKPMKARKVGTIARNTILEGNYLLA